MFTSDPVSINALVTQVLPWPPTSVTDADARRASHANVSCDAFELSLSPGRFPADVRSGEVSEALLPISG